MINLHYLDVHNIHVCNNSGRSNTSYVIKGITVSLGLSCTAKLVFLGVVEHTYTVQTLHTYTKFLRFVAVIILKNKKRFNNEITV